MLSNPIMNLHQQSAQIEMEMLGPLVRRQVGCIFIKPLADPISSECHRVGDNEPEQVVKNIGDHNKSFTRALREQ